MICGKVAILWVEPRDMIETTMLVLNPKIHSAIF